ncbi:hypothetical protein PG996_009237 [Apiospora saccharicola]|uniref:C2H2-type domain-containing protein n=1 Tax=Apiospora saccharicola TaxID=335842 RepID=A0ABR1UK67_9PEZI
MAFCASCQLELKKLQSEAYQHIHMHSRHTHRKTALLELTHEMLHRREPRSQVLLAKIDKEGQEVNDHALERDRHEYAIATFKCDHQEDQGEE